jgi:hypothetical protein
MNIADPSVYLIKRWVSLLMTPPWIASIITAEAPRAIYQTVQIAQKLCHFRMALCRMVFAVTIGGPAAEANGDLASKMKMRHKWLTKAATLRPL